MPVSKHLQKFSSPIDPETLDDPADDQTCGTPLASIEFLTTEHKKSTDAPEEIEQRGNSLDLSAKELIITDSGSRVERIHAKST